jgi:type VI secretion system protein VasI
MMKRIVSFGLPVVLSGVLLSSFPAGGEAQDLARRLAECSGLKDSAERLECYDALARSLTEHPEKPTGNWGKNEKENPLDDTRTVTLWLQATSVEPAYDESAFLFIRCRSGQTSVYITWNKALANAEVLVRLGKGDLERQYWNLSTDNEATFYREDAVTFAKALMESERLVAKVSPKDSYPTTAVFELAGLATAIEPLRQTCGW